MAVTLLSVAFKLAMEAVICDISGEGVADKEVPPKLQLYPNKPLLQRLDIAGETAPLMLVAST